MKHELAPRVLGPTISVLLASALLSFLCACGSVEPVALDGALGDDGGDTEVAADLLSLTISGRAALMPDFAPSQISYQASFSLVESRIVVTPTAQDVAATILVNGVAVASGSPSEVIVLDLGANQVTIEVTSSSGASKTYELSVDRGAAVIEQVAYAKASNTGQSDKFGTSLALYGDTLAVGAPHEASDAVGINGAGDNDDRNSSGAVYVFRRTVEGWAQEAYIKSSNSDGNDLFGTSVSLSKNRLAVGAIYEDSAATGVNGPQSNDNIDNNNSGAVYLFERSDTTWSQAAYFKASNTDSNDNFGDSVVLTEDTLVVAATGEDSSATGINSNVADEDGANSGAVYVFRLTGSLWAEEAYIKATYMHFGARFGKAMAMSGDTLVVGAPGEGSSAIGIGGAEDDTGAADSGAVYVYRRTGTSWSKEAYVKASNTDAGDAFGSSVALSEETLVVGAVHESSRATGINGDQDDDTFGSSGAAYVFLRVGTAWTQQSYIKADNTNGDDGFGTSVAVFGDLVAVSASGEDSNAVGVGGNGGDSNAGESGALYVFGRQGADWSQMSYVKASNTNTLDEFGTRVVMDGESLVSSAIFEGSNATGIDGNQGNNGFTGSGAVYIFH